MPMTSLALMRTVPLTVSRWPDAARKSAADVAASVSA